MKRKAAGEEGVFFLWFSSGVFKFVPRFLRFSDVLLEVARGFRFFLRWFPGDF